MHVPSLLKSLDSYTSYCQETKIWACLWQITLSKFWQNLPISNPKADLHNINAHTKKKVREKSRECHSHKLQPFPDPKRKRKPTNPNKHKPNKRTKSTKISSLFPKRGNRNTKRNEKHKNKMTHGKTYNKSPRRINQKQKRVRLTPGAPP